MFKKILAFVVMLYAVGAIGTCRGFSSRCGGPLRRRWRDCVSESRALVAAPAFNAAATVVRVLVARLSVSECA